MSIASKNRTRRSRTILNRKSSFEALEDRRLMAGDVTASLVGNTLFVNEAFNAPDQSNQVQVSTLGNGAIRVSGYTQNGDPSRINGKAFVDFSIPGGSVAANLVVNLRGGNDRIALWNANIDTALINTSSTNPANADVDMVDIQNLRTRGAVQVNTGFGVDSVLAKNVQIGDGIGNDDFTINTGSGSDYVKVGDLSSWSSIRGSLKVKTFDSLNVAEVDTVKVQLTTVHQSALIELGGGDDSVDMVASTIGKNLFIIAGDGRDNVKMREVQVIDSFFAHMGAGDDTLDLNYVRAEHMHLHGEEGRNTLVKTSDTSSRSLAQTGWSTVNGRWQKGVINTKLTSSAATNAFSHGR